MMKIKNFLKQQLNTHTNLNFEAPIVLRSNSWKTNEVLALRRRVGFNNKAYYLTTEWPAAFTEVNAEVTGKINN